MLCLKDPSVAPTRPWGLGTLSEAEFGEEHGRLAGGGESIGVGIDLAEPFPRWPLKLHEIDLAVVVVIQTVDEQNRQIIDSS